MVPPGPDSTQLLLQLVNRKGLRNYLILKSKLTQTQFKKGARFQSKQAVEVGNIGRVILALKPGWIQA